MLHTYSTGLLQAKAYRVLKNYLAFHLTKHHLTMPQWAFLGQIFEKKELRLSELAQILDVEAPFATNLADQLQRKGLVKRTENKADRRAKLITLTKKGEILVPEVESEVKDAMRKIFNSVSQAELATYLKVLQAIIIEYEI